MICYFGNDVDLHLKSTLSVQGDMISGKKVAAIMPAYNAEKTLRRTYDDIPLDIVDEVILVDDCSQDHTAELARELGLRVIVHERNRGYGGNQKTCYAEAVRLDADIVVMLHPDYQYTPKLIPAMAWMIAGGEYDVVLASRILGKHQVDCGMPVYKYIGNRFLTAAQNLLLGEKLSEYHTGYRAFRREVLESLPLLENSEGFVFDNQMIAQALFFGYRVGEISCPTRYFAEASSISLSGSSRYGLGVLITSLKYFLQKRKLGRFKIFNSKGRGLIHHPVSGEAGE